MLVMQVASQRMGLEPGRIMMVGDRLETDISMGQQAGMQTAVVLTGVTKREDIAGLALPPDVVAENLGELLDLVLVTSSSSSQYP
jgi:ribonucleotide monophosphatase NagD (HAD superfamily)